MTDWASWAACAVFVAFGGLYIIRRERLARESRSGAPWPNTSTGYAIAGVSLVLFGLLQVVDDIARLLGG